MYVVYIVIPRLCDQNSGLKSEHRQTQGRTDKSLKTEGPMILSNYIFYFKTVIIGGAIVDVHPEIDHV